MKYRNILTKSIFFEDYFCEVANRILKNDRHVIVNEIEQLDFFIDEALITNSNKALHLGIISKVTIFKIKDSIKYNHYNEDVLKNDNYDLILNQSEIRHLKDKKRRLSNDDIHNYIKKIPRIISEFDKVDYSKQKEEGLKFMKKFDDGIYFYLL